MANMDDEMTPFRNLLSEINIDTETLLELGPLPPKGIAFMSMSILARDCLKS